MISLKPETGVDCSNRGQRQSQIRLQVIKKDILWVPFLRQWAGRDEVVFLVYAANGDKMRVVTVDDFYRGSCPAKNLIRMGNSFI
jgi:hypothetical protein